MFQTLTTIHLITVAITLSGFLLRGIWMLQDSANLKRPIVRILPHLNDTILLVSAVWAGALINQYPFFNSWLTAKLMGTLVYIVFGAMHSPPRWLHSPILCRCLSAAVRSPAFKRPSIRRQARRFRLRVLTPRRCTNRRR